MVIDYAEAHRDGDIFADVAIVGAGVAGIAIAHALSRTNLSVALLESGGSIQDDCDRVLNEGESTGVPYPSLTDTRARCLGGASSHWGGWCAPLDPADFEPASWIRHSGWPLDYSTMAGYYDLAHSFLGFTGSEYSVGHWEEKTSLKALPLERDEVSSIIHRVCGPLNVGIRYRHMLSTSPNIVTYLHATVLRLEASTDHRKIIAADVALGSSSRVRLYAKKFVLATGGIENPRLLLLSEIGGAAVGRYFCEHPHLRCGGLSDIAERFDLRLYQEATYGSILERGCIVGALQIPEETRRLEHLSNAKLFFDLDGKEPGSADLVTVWEQEPNPLSHITLTTVKDRFGRPLPRLHWGLSEQDWWTFERSSELFKMSLERAGVGKVEAIPRPADALLHGIEPGHHHLGTTRMSTMPEMGVVDSNCRVHGIDNLYVAGTSVFPTGGHAPPTLTVIALALRLTDHLMIS